MKTIELTDHEYDTLLMTLQYAIDVYEAVSQKTPKPVERFA